MDWPKVLKGKQTNTLYYFVGSHTGKCARYLGKYGEVYITETEVNTKDGNWITSNTIDITEIRIF